MNFGLLGVAGYVAPRHLAAIRDNGHRLVAAMDPHDSVGVLDGYFPEARFFRDPESFERLLTGLRSASDEERIHWLSICSPNDFHEAHLRLALENGVDAICEKPLLIDPHRLDAVQDLERAQGRRVYAVLQLRSHPGLRALKDDLDRRQASPNPPRHQVSMTYITPRGAWYQSSWKGDPVRSGGLAVNIGIHLFDLLIWLFGTPRTVALHERSPTRLAGFLELERADVRWFLSIEARDLPVAERPPRPFRSLRIDGAEVPFDASPSLHTDLYRSTLEGRGIGIDEARASVELTHDLRHRPVEAGRGLLHPLIADPSSPDRFQGMRR